MEKTNKLSRRAILGGVAVGAGGLGAAALVGGGGSGAAALAGLGRQLSPLMEAKGNWWNGGRVVLRYAALQEWSLQVGDVFEIEGEGGSSSFKLVETRPLPAAGTRPRNVARKLAFLLVFEGDRELAGDAIYQVRHAGEALPVFFSSAGAGSSLSRLQAVFN